jgi:A/G-specific adenine glycosylase
VVFDKKNFSDRLLHWYGGHKRNLPWRKTKDPYRIWISEVMLQQTTVQAVLPYYRAWLKIFPDIRSLARAPLQRVLKAWQGLGYYGRARNLHATAKMIVENHRGKMPHDPDVLARLPGFGPYTTAAVLSLAYQKVLPVLEANVRRVMMRLAALHGKADGRHDKAILAELRKTIDRKSPGDFNQALMELGALVCRARNPQCLLCPIQTSCAAYARGEQDVIPAPRSRSSQKVKAVLGIIRKGAKYLIQQRPETGLLAGLWEFPGGKAKRGETLEKALARELNEELGVELHDAKFLLKVEHCYTQYRVALHAYACRLKTEPALEPGRQKWVALRDLHKYPIPSGSSKIVRFLENK